MRVRASVRACISAPALKSNLQLAVAVNEDKRRGHVHQSLRVSRYSGNPKGSPADIPSGAPSQTTRSAFLPPRALRTRGIVEGNVISVCRIDIPGNGACWSACDIAKELLSLPWAGDRQRRPFLYPFLGYSQISHHSLGCAAGRTHLSFCPNT